MENITSGEEDYILLKGGHKTHDPRLGRVPQFDKRNLDFNVTKIFTAKQTAPRTNTHRCLQWLDQLNEPACVGFAFSHNLIAHPKEVQGCNYDTALALYHRAQDLDEWPGHQYEGTSILGGAKASVETGKIGGYHWAFTALDMAITVSWHKCIILGCNWYNSMFNVDANGFIKVGGGGLAGGHAILVRGYNVEKNAFLLRNSWGLGWGVSGDCWVSFADMERLLSEQGEACVPDQQTL